MITKELKNAVADVLAAAIDRANFGMLSRYRARFDSCKLLHAQGITIGRKMYGNEEIKNADGVTLGVITYKFAATKRNGMYKLLKPVISWSE